MPAPHDLRPVLVAWAGFGVILAVMFVGVYGFANPRFAGLSVLRWAAIATLTLGSLVLAWQVYHRRRAGASPGVS